MIHNISVPIYKDTIIFTNDREEYDQLDDQTELNVPDFVGLSNLIFIDDKPTFLIGVFDESTSTLVHEIVHVALNMIESCSFNAHDGNGEPMSYLVEYLFSELEPLIRIDQ
jgi:hypothetical protein